MDNNKIYINQIGYKCDAKKRFWVCGEYKSFKIKRKEDNEIVYQGELKQCENDDCVCETINVGEFSDVCSSGDYYIFVDGLGKSYNFKIGSDIFNNLGNSLLKMLYIQRCGIDLEPEYAGVYEHKACHMNYGKLYDNKEKTIDGTGGWHDAGDYGKYAVPCARTIADLLFAFTCYSNKFDDDLNIPESGNGIPDILDEAKVGLDWLLKMQHEGSGGIYHKFTPETFCGMIMPEEEKQQDYAFEISSTATADFCAITAKAAMIFEKYDTDYACALRSSAKKAYHFLENNINIPLFRNPDGVITGEYYDTSDLDERYWAAVEMYLAFGEKKYLDDAKVYYRENTILERDDKIEWDEVGFIGSFSYLLSDLDEDTEFKKNIKQDIFNVCDSFVKGALKKNFGIYMNKKDYSWGSNLILINRAVILVLANEIEQRKEYIETAQAHLDYLLGANILSLSFITGFGSNRIMFPHHRPSEADNIEEPIPGMVIGGTNANLQDELMQSKFSSNDATMKCYIDHVDAYSVNEVATYWNSAVLLAISYFM